MFLRLAEGLQHTQIAQHPQQPLTKLTPECLLRRAEAYGHWAKHLSHHNGTSTVPIILDFDPHIALTKCTALWVRGSFGLAAEYESVWKHGTIPSQGHDQCMCSDLGLHSMCMFSVPAGCKAVLVATGTPPIEDPCAANTMCLVPRLVLQRVTFLEGHPGCLALQTAIAMLQGNKVQAHHCLQVRSRLQQLPAMTAAVEGYSTHCQTKPVSIV